MNIKCSHAAAQWKRAFSLGARVIGALNIGSQLASGYAVHGSLSVPRETLIVEDAYIVNSRYALSFQRVQISKRRHWMQYAIFWCKKHIFMIAKTLAFF